MEEIPMSTDKNVQTVMDFLAAIGRVILAASGAGISKGAARLGALAIPMK